MPDHLAEATAAVQAAVPLAEANPLRPVYHFRPPAQWTNDPNGAIYHDGWYHLFYQHNPFAPDWGPMYWGHARSRDLVHWEHLPIALVPSYENDETHCYSGCAAVNGQGQAMVFYTSVALGHDAQGKVAQTRPCQQWAAVSDDWVTWRKHPDNPMLPPQPGFRDDWRDPFLFRHEGRSFIVVGMCGPGTALYEAQDDTLSRWTYRGIISDLSAECPNFFPLQGKFVYLFSPFEAVEYRVGTLTPPFGHPSPGDAKRLIGRGAGGERLEFIPQTQGVLDPGRVDDNGFYASNVLFDEQGRCVLFGWINGCGGEGWRGIISLPRELTIGEDGHPRQRPVAELQQLRGAQANVPPQMLQDRAIPLPNPAANNLEINLRFNRKGRAACGLKLLWPGHETLVRFDGSRFHVAGVEGEFALADGAPLDLQVFLDRCVVEVFVNEGRTCISRCLEAGTAPVALEAFVEGRAEVEGMVYEMTAVW